MFFTSTTSRTRRVKPSPSPLLLLLLQVNIEYFMIMMMHSRSKESYKQSWWVAPYLWYDGTCFLSPHLAGSDAMTQKGELRAWMMCWSTSAADISGPASVAGCSSCS